MALSPIRLISQLDDTTPDGALVPVSEMDDYIRQLKGFLKEFLTVGHNDDGSLKEELEIKRFDQISGQIDPSQIPPRSIGPEHLTTISGEGSPAVLEDNLGDGVVSERILADNSVAENKLQDNSVGTANLKNASVTADKLAGSIPASKIIGLAGSTIEDGTITASKHEPNALFSVSAPGLVAIADSAANSKIAQIGGVLSAVIEAGTPPILKFAFANPVTIDDGAMAVCVQDPIVLRTVTGGSGVDYLRRDWSRIIGENLVTIASTGGGIENDIIRITKRGRYLCIFQVGVYGDSGDAVRIDAGLKVDDTMLIRTNSHQVNSSTVDFNFSAWGVMGFTVTDEAGADLQIVSRITLVGSGSIGTWYQGAANTRCGMLFLAALNG